MHNRYEVIGNLGGEPTTGGKGKAQWCRFSVASSEKWTNAEGEKMEHTEWHNVVCWGKLAEVCARVLHKGRKVFVMGSIKSSEYTDKEGIKRRGYDLRAQKVHFLDAPRDQNERQREDGPVETAAEYHRRKAQAAGEKGGW